MSKITLKIGDHIAKIFFSDLERTSVHKISAFTGTETWRNADGVPRYLGESPSWFVNRVEYKSSDIIVPEIDGAVKSDHIDTPKITLKIGDIVCQWQEHKDDKDFAIKSFKNYGWINSVCKVLLEDFETNQILYVNGVKYLISDIEIPTPEIPIKDNVNSPNHYTQGGIETIDYIKAKLGKKGFVDYCMGNVLKYSSRYQHKNGLEDLQKAQVYLGWAIENYEQ